jgi:hypothetical protein
VRAIAPYQIYTPNTIERKERQREREGEGKEKKRCTSQPLYHISFPTNKLKGREKRGEGIEK